MDLSDYQKAIDTSTFFVSKGNVETALEVIQEAFRILYLEKETDGLQEPGYHEIETLLTKKYLALKAKQEKLQKRQMYFKTFIHTLVVCLVIFSFMFVGSFFIKNYITNVSTNITDTITDRLESKIKAKLTPEKIFKKASTFYGSLNILTKLKIVAIIKQDPELFYQLGLMQEKKGDIDNAIKKLEWARYLKPDNVKFNKKLEALKKYAPSDTTQTTKD